MKNKNKFKGFSFGALVFFSSLSMAVIIENPGFETGDLDGWEWNNEGSGAGVAYVTQSYMGIDPNEISGGNNFAVVVAGCQTTTLTQTFSANAGEVLTFWSFFKANDVYDSFFNDTGTVSIVNDSDLSETVLFSYSIEDVGDYGQTPWVPEEFLVPSGGAGDYLIKVLSTNVGDCNFNSVVGIDSVEDFGEPQVPGGFVVGGGWINSPEGAYKGDSDLTGKANFGFVSKHKKDAVTPTGNIQFQFKAGDINFHSDEYESLVTDDSATNAQFQGVGTINGAGNFGFMLWGSDDKNNTDTFRIQIWDIDNGDVVIYDNGEPQPLDGGNIIVKAQ